MNFTVNQIINSRYQLLQSIGLGSFGEVWLAKDNVLDMNIAIKIYVALDSRGFKEFKQEFRTAYSLHHPNLLRADYFDSVEKNPYLVMPFCPESVGDKIGKMKENELWKFIYDVSGGLEYLHDNDVIHRDIKPDNILRNEQGIYVITDFGLSTKMRSTLRKASAWQNEANSSGGTIGYMAPEMFAASPQAVKATDIWALGATIFELVTGEIPFCGQGGVMETYGAEIPEIPNLHDISLSSLIQQCLAKDPWDRPTAHSIHLQAAKQLGIAQSASNGGASDNQKYLKQIEKLKEELKRLKNNSGNRNKVFKPNLFSILFFVALVGLCGIIAVFMLSKHDYEEKINSITDRLSSTQNLIDDIQDLIDSHARSNEETFSDWTSENHGHKSTGTREYEFEASVGDKLSFDYDVDTETYDHFICILSHNGVDTEIENVSGKEKRGVTRYTIQDDGSYGLKLIYKKDASIHSGRDDVRVSNIRLEKCVEGKIKRALYDYKQSKTSASEENEIIFVEENVDSIAVF